MFNEFFFRSLMLSSIFLFYNNTPIFYKCLTSCWSCLGYTACHSLIPIWFWFVRVTNLKQYRQVGYIANKLFSKKLDFFPTFWTFIKELNFHLTLKLCVNSRNEITFPRQTESLCKIIVKLALVKWRFFSSSFSFFIF